MQQYEKNIPYKHFEVSKFNFLYACKHTVVDSFMICSFDLPDFPVEQVHYQVVQQIICQAA